MSSISVDFDGTLCSNKWPEIGEANLTLINYLKKAKSQGFKLILNTMREGEKLDDAVKWCKTLGLEFDAVNDNLPELVEGFGCNPRKIYADYYFDDHNVYNFGRKGPILRRHHGKA